MSFLEIDPTLLAVLGGSVMGILQALKPFIPDNFNLITLGLLSSILGVVLALSMEAANISQMAIQVIANTYFIVIAAAGPYSIVKAVKNPENPAGI